VNALLELGETEIAALRTNKGQKKVGPELEQKVLSFHIEEEALGWEPTHMIISNPTSLHIHYIKLAEKHNIKYFVEKPVCENLSETEEISAMSEKKLKNGIVGYQLRFHGVFLFIKECIDSHKYGDIVTARMHVGQYLPFWHPYEDYRKGYYAQKSLGGGALKTLSHELDLARFLFGKINSIFSKVEKLSKLEIDVDDVCDLIVQTDDCKRLTIHINFLDPQIVRTGTVYFDKGVMQYDFMKGVIHFSDYTTKETKEVYNTNEGINAQYIRQMQHFVMHDESSLSCKITEGIEAMKFIEACELSNHQNKTICLD
jgi:predicted dehydrogenase